MDHETHDYSTGPNAVVRVVRPKNHVGHSYAGDRVRLDADELKQPAIAAALWTEGEAHEAALELERRRASAFREDVPSQMRAVDGQLAAAAEQRRRETEKARRRMPDDR